jgi:hypothetical protein
MASERKSKSAVFDKNDKLVLITGDSQEANNMLYNVILEGSIMFADYLTDEELRTLSQQELFDLTDNRMNEELNN